MRQKDIIYQHLLDNGSITRMEAYTQYGITRLSGRIHDLRKEGKNIISTRERSRNRYGRMVVYDRYVLMQRKRDAE